MTCFVRLTSGCDCVCRSAVTVWEIVMVIGVCKTKVGRSEEQLSQGRIDSLSNGPFFVFVTLFAPKTVPFPS